MQSRTSPVERLLFRLAHPVGEVGDGDLLARFAATADEESFAELVRRHRPMVERVARRVVGQASDADDVAQAVFLVLARRAKQLAPRGQLGDWLHGVAVRTALRARVRAARRRVVESKAARPEAVAAEVPDDLSVLVDRAVRSLPAGQREVVVLCDLQQLPRLEAARRLGIPEGTVSSRLASAHAKLARRLRRSWPAVAAILATPTLPSLAEAGFGASVLLSLPATAPAQLLALEVLAMSIWSPVKLVAATGLTLTAALAVGVGVGVGQGPGGAPRATPPVEDVKPAEAPPGGFGKPGVSELPGAGGKVGGGAPGSGAQLDPFAQRSRLVANAYNAVSGSWTVESMTIDDKPIPVSDGERVVRMAFDRTRVTVTRRLVRYGRAPFDQDAVMMVRLNPHRSPAEMTLVIPEPPADTPAAPPAAPRTVSNPPTPSDVQEALLWAVRAQATTPALAPPDPCELVPHIFRVTKDEKLQIARYRTAYPANFNPNAPGAIQSNEQDRPRGFTRADEKPDAPELVVITLSQRRVEAAPATPPPGQ